MIALRRLIPPVRHRAKILRLNEEHTVTAIRALLLGERGA